MTTVRLPYTKNPSADFATAPSNGIGRPMLFQMTKVGSLEPLWPVALALHVSPSSLNESFTKSKNIIVTRGGIVENIWPDDIDSLSADSTTGAFIGADSGLTADSANPRCSVRRGVGSVRSFRGRHGTMAWERHTDFIELFRSNGQIYDGYGVPILRSQVMCIYDRGVFFGFFTSFDETESSDVPFQFKVSWEFKITQSVYKFPIMTPEAVTTEPTIQVSNVPQSPEASQEAPATPPVPELLQSSLDFEKASDEEKRRRQVALY